MFGFGKKKDKKGDGHKKGKKSKRRSKEVNDDEDEDGDADNQLTTSKTQGKQSKRRGGKEEIEDVAAILKRLAIPESPYSSPFPFPDAPPKILTAYAKSVYNANEGRLLTIEMEKVYMQCSHISCYVHYHIVMEGLYLFSLLPLCF